MARRVSDAALVAAAVADDPDWFAVRNTPGAPRLGLLTGSYLEAGPAINDCLAVAVAAWQASGAIVQDLRSPVDLNAVHAAHRIITFAECAAVHHDRLPQAASGYGPRARELLDLGRLTPAYAYARAQNLRAGATERVLKLFNSFDAIVLPVVPDASPSTGSSTGDSRFQIPWTLCGLPAVSVPIGTANGLPVGVQLIAIADAEHRLITAAQWCEEALELDLRPTRT